MKHWVFASFIVFFVSSILFLSINPVFGQSGVNLSEQTTLSEDLANDPIAQDILKKIEQKKNGVAWLLGGIVVSIPGLSFYFLTGGAWGAGVFIGIIYFILWIVQILSSAGYCKQWNRAVAEGVIPW